MQGMQRYVLATNYIQLRDNDDNKGPSIYIDVRPKALGNITGFINSAQLGTTNKQPNCIFEAREGSHVFICALRSINAWEELLINYNLNQIDIDIAIMGEIHNLSLMILYAMFII